MILATVECNKNWLQLYITYVTAANEKEPSPNFTKTLLEKGLTVYDLLLNSIAISLKLLTYYKRLF